MYIIAIGWIFVTLLMALTEPNLTAGFLSFGFYGLVPLALFLWLMGTPQRRRNQSSKSTDRTQASSVPPRQRRALARETIDQLVGEPDRCNPGTDQ